MYMYADVEKRPGHPKLQVNHSKCMQSLRTADVVQQDACVPSLQRAVRTLPRYLAWLLRSAAEGATLASVSKLPSSNLWSFIKSQCAVQLG